MTITKNVAGNLVMASTLEDRLKGQILAYIRSHTEWAEVSEDIKAEWGADMVAGYLERCMQPAPGEHIRISTSVSQLFQDAVWSSFPFLGGMGGMEQGVGFCV